MGCWGFEFKGERLGVVFVDFERGEGGMQVSELVGGHGAGAECGGFGLRFGE